MAYILLVEKKLLMDIFGKKLLTDFFRKIIFRFFRKISLLMEFFGLLMDIFRDMYLYMRLAWINLTNTIFISIFQAIVKIKVSHFFLFI